jgi:glutamine amidotransferase
VCRHLAYVGPAVRLGSVLIDPPHALVRQAWAPRRQTHGIMNVDGFGVGWYVPGDPVPARHRGVGPVWGDETFADLGRAVSSTSFLAAVRSATEGMAQGLAACAPLRAGPWLFSYNGALDNWPATLVRLAAEVAPERLAQLDAPTDTGLLWAMTRQYLDAGKAPGDALATVVNRAHEDGGVRLNLLLTDGTTIWATAWGASLSTFRSAPPGPGDPGPGDPGPGDPGPGVVVASEPHDDRPGWQDVPDRSLVTATPEGIQLSSL